MCVYMYMYMYILDVHIHVHICVRCVYVQLHVCYNVCVHMDYKEVYSLPHYVYVYAYSV